MPETKRTRRGGIDYDITKGLTPEGENRNFVETVNPVNEGQRERIAPDFLHVEFDKSEKNGAIVSIETKFFKVMLTATGKPMGDLGPLRHSTKKDERNQFAALFQKINELIQNGLFRGPLGFNDKPVYDASGNLIIYTPEQENEPPIYYPAPGSYHYVEPVAEV